MEFKLNTIKGKKAFSYVFENGKKFFEENSMAVFYFAANDLGRAVSLDCLDITYSVSVPKKSAKKAVVRNRIKRLMRESIRHFFLEYNHSKFPCHTLTVALVWRNAPKHPMLIGLNDVSPEIYRLLSRGLDFYRKNNPNRI